MDLQLIWSKIENLYRFFPKFRSKLTFVFIIQGFPYIQRNLSNFKRLSFCKKKNVFLNSVKKLIKAQIEVLGPCLVQNCVLFLYFSVKMSTDYYFDTLKVIKDALQFKKHFRNHLVSSHFFQDFVIFLSFFVIFFRIFSHFLSFFWSNPA